MDDAVSDDPKNMSACASCGVFRRDILSRYAADLDADKLLTGHNIDDEAETALLDFLGGDIRKVSRQFDASLGFFEGGTAGSTRAESDECSQCDSPTTGDRCRKCGLLEALGAV